MGLVYIDADHRGFDLKKKLIEFLKENDFEVKDLGGKKIEPDDDYSEIAIRLAEKVVKEKRMGILICRSGIGVCMVANKVDGARAALCASEKQARLSREDEDANILCLSSELVDEEINFKIAKTFLTTVFSCEERFIRRINEIKKYEETRKHK
jgi:ribose 5-phosphate isomerase B